MNDSRFELGQVVATAGAALALARAKTQPEELLERHSSAADFGDVDAAQRKANLAAIENGGQVRSVYRLRSGEVLLVVTEVGVTTSIVCPGEE